MRRNYGYGSYRGKSAFRTFLKIVAVALAIVLVLLVAAFFFLQQHMVVTSDGIRFDLPFLGGEPSPAPSQVIVVETPDPVIITPEPTPTPAPRYARMITIPDDVLHDDAVKGLYDSYQAGDGSVEAAYPGFGQSNQLIFNMKGADGLLGYISDIPLAREVKSSHADPARQEGIKAANAAEGGALYNAAYISCFEDNTAPYNNNALALRTSIGNWRAPGDQRWMSPQVAEAREYITEVCAELGDLGFTDLILDSAAFPTEGDLSLILRGDRYGPDTFASTITAFYRQVREAVEGFYADRAALSQPFRLGIVTDKATVLDGANPLSGQTLDALVQYADRIYVDLEGEDPAACFQALRDAGVERPEEFLVAILEQPPAGDVDYGWAVLPE